MISTLRYISPKGNAFALDFSELSRSGGKKAPVTESPGSDVSVIQDLGKSTTEISLSCYITGTGYVDQANAFWNSLSESGSGTLEHPRYGDLKVVPSTRSQSERFVDGAGRVTFDVSFFVDEGSEEIESEIDYESVLEASAQITATSILESLSNISPVRATIDAFKLAQKHAKSVAGFVESIEEISDDLFSEIENAISEISRLASDVALTPSKIMKPALTFYRLPARIGSDVTAKINGIEKTYQLLISGFEESTKKYGENFGVIASANLVTLSLSASESVALGVLETRTDITKAIEALNRLQKNIDASLRKIEEIGKYKTDFSLLLKLEKTRVNAIDFLLNEAKKMPSQKTLTADKVQTPLHWAYELTGDVANVDELISVNNLGGLDLLCVPRGKVLVYGG